jgi:ribosomal protein S18 acetylase RimI-like enzyme
MAYILREAEELSLSFRPAEPADDSFLRELYARTHGRELQLLPMPAAQLTALLNMQFQAQRQFYQAQYPHSERLLILIDGDPVGHLWLAAGPDEWRILDIALLSEYRRHGTGTAVLNGVIEKARESEKPLRLSVQRANPDALRLYRQLGFKEISDNGASIEMEFPR